MLSREDYIRYWKTTGNNSWEAGVYLMEGKRNPEALFMFCLASEKWIKANWVLDNVDLQAPRIHDLQSLTSQTDLLLEPELIDFLDTVNRWNLEGRYPDYKFSLHRLATDEYMQLQFKKLQHLRTCLLERL
jgi:HEPN domain-containing protein